MPDTIVCTVEGCEGDHDVPRDYGAPIAALRWQAGAHRRRAAGLRMKAANRLDEAVRHISEADQHQRGADHLAHLEQQEADGGGVSPSAAVDLLRHRADEHREAAHDAECQAADLRDEAEGCEHIAEGLERSANRLQHEPEGNL
jgi:hypothetical protein